MMLALFLLLAAVPGFEESFRAGLLALQRNDLQAAEANLSAAAKLEPNNGRVWIALAQTYRKLGDGVKADGAAAKAATLGAGDPLVRKSLVIYYSEAGLHLKAAEVQMQDPAGREKAESLYFEAVQPLLQKQKFAEAIAILTKARERLKNSAQLELALGVAYYGMRRFDDAAAAFLATIGIAPDTEQPYVFLGKFLDQIPGRLPAITARFAAYQTAHPESALGYLLHAKALIAQSIEPEMARTLLEKALSINEREPSVHFELGAMHFRAQRLEEAAREFERSAALDPANPATHYRLANVYSRLGKREAAQAERDLHAKLAKAQDPGQ